MPLRNSSQSQCVIGHIFFAVDVATTAAQAYRDVQRFNESEIGAGALAVKIYLRSENVYLAYIAVYDPEPITRFSATIALIAVVALDATHDAIIDSRAKAARRLLESIDLEERDQTVRSQLLHEVRLLEVNNIPAATSPQTVNVVP